MTLRPLQSRDYGFETDCFVCEAGNDLGLRVPFVHDDEADVVRADWTFGSSYSGAPSFVHGGVTLALLDESMAWATIAIAGKFAVTRETSARFLRPVYVDSPYRVEATIADRDEKTIVTEGRVIDQEGKEHVTARAEFVILSPVQAAAATGGPEDGLDHVSDFLHEGS